MLANRVVRLLVNNGARVAERGEFTKRAFLNGRLDLAQAEAVNELISAKTEFGVSVAFDQLQGAISAEMIEIKNSIMTILSEIEAFVDFPEDDVEI